MTTLSARRAVFILQLACAAVASIAALGCRSRDNSDSAPLPAESVLAPIFRLYSPANETTWSCGESETEPGPEPTYVECTGDSQFGIVATGPQPFQFRPVHRTVLAVSYPRLFELTSAGLRELPRLPRLAGHLWTQSRLDDCAGTLDNLVAEIDEVRHYGAPSEKRICATLRNGAWSIERRPEAHLNWRYGLHTWSDGRVLLETDKGVFWIDSGASADAAVAGCFKPYVFAPVEAAPSTTAKAVAPADTHVACVPSALVPHVFYTQSDLGKDMGNLISLHNGALVMRSHAEGVAAGTCMSRAGSKSGCYARLTRGKAEPEDGPPWRTPVSTGYQSDGTRWMAARGERSGLKPGTGPWPLGEVFKRKPAGSWERVTLPSRKTDDGWLVKRFVAEHLAVVDDHVWVEGYWYEVHKPSPKEVIVRNRHGLLLFGYSGVAIDVDRPDAKAVFTP